MANYGLIKTLKRDKGFGFIRTDSGVEYFFHVSGLVGVRYDDLVEGQRVEFEVEDSAKGPRANRVSLA